MNRARRWRAAWRVTSALSNVGSLLLESHARHPARLRPHPARRRRHRHQSVCDGPHLRRRARDVEPRASRSRARAAPGLRRRRLRHHPDQQLRRQRAPADAARHAGPRARDQPARRPASRARSPTRPDARRRRGFGRADGRPVRTARRADRADGDRGVRGADARPQGRRRRRRLDRDHVVARGNPRGGDRGRQRRHAVHVHRQFRHGRTHDDGHHARSAGRIRAEPAIRRRSPSAPTAASARRTSWSASSA